MTTVKNIYDYINSIAPFDTQEEWDNSGFLLGEYRKPVKKAVLTLDVTKKVSELAAGIGADLIISHHPVIFSPLTEIKKGSVVYTLVNHDIACISAHTNFDKATCGINAKLAEMLGLDNVYFLDNGFVAVGELDYPMSMDDFAQYVSECLDCSGIRYTDTDRLIKKVAVGGGACAEFMQQACENSDCFVTGDLKYHDMLDASEQGFAVVSAGHFETENKPFLSLYDALSKMFSDVEFVLSEQENAVKTI